MNVINQFDTETLIDERYKIDTLLGSGRSGSVYCARDMHLERMVGLKFLNVSATDDDASAAIKRFEREAKALHLLDHPNIVKVFRYGVLNGATPYLALEFIEGNSLREELNEKRKLSGSEIISIAKCICSAMDYAHSQNIIHRDLKPENIILLRKTKTNSAGGAHEESESQIYAKVVDFGLCKLSDSETDSTNLTRGGFLTGTPAYMAPEQCMGKVADKRVDIYAFACILFEMLSGKTPFTACTAAELLYKHINEKPLIIPKETSSKESQRAHSQMLRIIDRCLHKDPDLRYQSFSELAEDLNKITVAELETNPEIRNKPPLPNPLKKSATIFIAITALAIGASATLGAVFFKDEIEIRVAALKQDLLPENQSVSQLAQDLTSLLKVGKKEQATRLVTASTQSARFSSWSPRSQLALLERYFETYRLYGTEKESINLSIEILIRALRQLPTGEIAVTTTPPQSLVNLINKHCEFIRKSKLDKDSLKRVSKGLEEIVSAFPKKAPKHVFAPANLRCELAERLIRPNSWNDKMRVIRYYDYLMDVIAGSPELAPFTVDAVQHIFKLGDVKNYEYFQDHAQLFKEVFLARISLFKYYCKIKDKKNADLELAKIQREQQVILLSHRIEEQIKLANAEYESAFRSHKK